MGKMNLNTAKEPVYHYDMCAHCTLDTGGQHEPDCPLAKPPFIFVPFGERYADFVKRAMKEIDDHPEWGLEYL